MQHDTIGHYLLCSPGGFVPLGLVGVTFVLMCSELFGRKLAIVGFLHRDVWRWQPNAHAEDHTAGSVWWEGLPYHPANPVVQHVTALSWCAIHQLQQEHQHWRYPPRPILSN